MFHKLVLSLTMLTVTAHAVFGCCWHHAHEHADSVADREMPMALAEGASACLHESERGHAEHAAAEHTGSGSTGFASHGEPFHHEGPVNHEPHDCASCVFTRPQVASVWAPELAWTTFAVVMPEVRALPVLVHRGLAAVPIDSASIRVCQQVWRI